MTSTHYANLVSSAAAALKERKEEVNRLNVFPVPDGDTGTNMSLTMDVVVAEVAALPADVGHRDRLPRDHARIADGSARQLRCHPEPDPPRPVRGHRRGRAGRLPSCSRSRLERSVVVAFQAVRKPVEGTMLTVLRDSSIAARGGRRGERRTR